MPGQRRPTPRGGSKTSTERLFVTPAHRLDVGPVDPAASTSPGILNDKLRGWYRSTYTDDDGVERVIATTQMQATDCRRAFPCWDEPDFKATFSITLVVEPDLLAVSNCREIERTERDGKTVVRFAETMPMSTYLVAFVVGPLEATDPIDVDGVPLRIVHVPGKAHLTEFGLDVGAAALRWFQEYYGIAYPSDKVDLLGLPDFAAGAMENLGCITFRESLLLVDPQTATQQELELVVDVVAHELAHMWFGDLVTMRWWNGIWLNEAFATFMEIAACDAYRPEWHRWTSFGLERSVAFDTDSLESTRPVEYEVRSPADCEGMFDVLTYQKGGALLRMLEQYLGAEAFRKGVSHYLDLHAHGNTETNDLWDAIEAVTGEPVRRIMDSWIWQPGFPLVSARLDGATLVARPAPIRVRRVGRPDAVGDPAARAGRRRRLAPSSTACCSTATKRGIDLDAPDGPVVVNAGGHGFFRVAYDDVLRARLGGEHARRPRSPRALQPRRRRLERRRRRPPRRPPSSSRFVEGFAGDRDLAVWQAITVGLRGIGRLLDDERFPPFQRRVSALVTPVVEDLGEPADGRGRPARQAARSARGHRRDARRRRAHPAAGPRVVRPQRRGARLDRSRAGLGGDVGARRHRRRRRLRADPRRLPLGGDTRRTNSATCTRSPSSTRPIC